MVSKLYLSYTHTHTFLCLSTLTTGKYNSENNRGNKITTERKKKNLFDILSFFISNLEKKKYYQTGK